MRIPLFVMEANNTNAKKDFVIWGIYNEIDKESSPSNSFHLKTL
jgi:hypothetical protein